MYLMNNYSKMILFRPSTPDVKGKGDIERAIVNLFY